MEAKNIKDPTRPNSGIAFCNWGKFTPNQPDIVGKFRAPDGKVYELALFAKGTDGTLMQLHKARFLGLSIRQVEEQVNLPTIEEEDNDYGTRLDNLG